MAATAVYRFVDRRVPARRAVYWLDAVSADGSRRMLGRTRLASFAS
jgi:hypothetical protein